MKKIFLALCLLSVIGCSKNQNASSVVQQNEVVKNSFDPEKLILDSTLELPEKYKNKIKQSDRLIWQITNGAGHIVAGDLRLVPRFPYHIQLKAKHIAQPLLPSDTLIFSARIVKQGEEYKPPEAGQLTVLLGKGESEVKNPTVKPALSAKAIAEIEKKTKEKFKFDSLAIGSQVKASFEPATF